MKRKKRVTWRKYKNLKSFQIGIEVIYVSQFGSLIEFNLPFFTIERHKHFIYKSS